MNHDQRTMTTKSNRLFLRFASVMVFVAAIPFVLFSPTTFHGSQSTVPMSSSRGKNSTFPKQNIDKQSSPSSPSIQLRKITPPIIKEACAVCFFGLPRSFKRLVLPSVVKNILLPNQHHHCDVYVHYYQIENEGSGRGANHGGHIAPEDMLLLGPAMEKLYKTQHPTDKKDYDPPYMGVSKDTNATFWEKRGDLLHKYRTVRDPSDGNHLLYFPWNAKTYTFPGSIDNLAMQWHSIQSVWEEMERGGKAMKKNYTRVAMLRNDVFYMTPFDMFKLNRTSQQDMSQAVATPNWAKYPVNDRMIYGAHEGVKIWATERFQRLEDHVRTYEDPGYGMHSERFLEHSIFPAIAKLGIHVMLNPEICFFRTRASGSIWINDCATRAGAARGFRKLSGNATKEIIFNTTGIECPINKLTKKIIEAQCGEGAAT